MDARWRHTQGVARRAAEAAPAVSETDRPVLVAAAWMHDIGYAESLRRSGFHPLDGACYLQEHAWPERLAGLVAHHSAARFVATVHGLAAPLQAFPADRYGSGPVPDALTYADQTTGPTGERMDVEDRLAGMLRRHGPDSPNARVHHQRAPAIRAAVDHTERRLRAGHLIGTGPEPGVCDRRPGRRNQ
jgi:HD domain